MKFVLKNLPTLTDTDIVNDIKLNPKNDIKTSDVTRLSLARDPFVKKGKPNKPSLILATFAETVKKEKIREVGDKLNSTVI